MSTVPVEKQRRQWWNLPEVNIAGALIALTLATWLYNPKFLSASNIQIITRDIAIFAIMGIGETMVIISGGIDLAPGSLVALSGVLVALFMTRWMPMSVAILLVVLLCAGIGLWHGIFVTKLKVPPFIITLGTFSIARGIATVICSSVTGGQPIIGLPPQFAIIGQGSIKIIPVSVLMLLALFVISSMIMHWTRLGRYIYAVGGNLEAARLSGVPVDAVRILCYTISAALAGLSGIINASYINSGDPNTGIAYELYVIAAAVVGGTSLLGGRGTIIGTLLGASMMSVIKNSTIFLDISTYWQDVVVGAVVVIAVTLDTLRRRASA